MRGTGGWENKEKRDIEWEKSRKVCRGVSRERKMLPFGYRFGPAVHSAIDNAYKNEIRTSPNY